MNQDCETNVIIAEATNSSRPGNLQPNIPLIICTWAGVEAILATSQTFWRHGD